MAIFSEQTSVGVSRVRTASAVASALSHVHVLPVLFSMSGLIVSVDFIRFHLHLTRVSVLFALNLPVD